MESFSLSKLKKAAETLEPDDGIQLAANSEVVIVLEHGQRHEIPHSLAKRIFGSLDNLEKVKDCFSGTECLEFHQVRIDDDVWIVLEECFAMVDEV